MRTVFTFCHFFSVSFGKLFSFEFRRFLLYFQALTPQQNATLEQYSKPCRDETGVTAQDIDTGLNGEDRIDDSKLKAHVLCVLKKIELINEDGDVDMEKLKKLAKLVAASEEEAESVVAKCALQKDTHEDTAFRTISYLYEKWPQNVEWKNHNKCF